MIVRDCWNASIGLRLFERIFISASSLSFLIQAEGGGEGNGIIGFAIEKEKKKRLVSRFLSLFLTFFLFFFFRGKGMFVPLSFLELRVEGITGYGSRVGGRERERYGRRARAES